MILEYVGQGGMLCTTEVESWHFCNTALQDVVLLLEPCLVSAKIISSLSWHTNDYQKPSL